MKKKISIFNVIIAIFFILLCISMFYPFWNSLVKSVSNNAEIMRGNVFLWPVGWTWGGYIELMNDSAFFLAFKNTIFVVIMGTTLRVILALMAGFAFSKKNLRFRGILLSLFIFTMFFNGGIVPTFITINNIGLYDNIWVLILLGSMPVYHMILAMSFFRELPVEIEESAFVDGANFWQIYIKIILPISKPLVATLIIFNTVALYNIFMPTVIYTQSLQNYVMQVYVRLKVFAAEAAANGGDLQTLSMLDSDDTGTETLKIAVLPYQVYQ